MRRRARRPTSSGCLVARNLSLAALGVAALLGAAAPFLPRGAPVDEVTGPGDAEIAALADGVAATLRETAAGVHARAATLSDSKATADAVGERGDLGVTGAGHVFHRRAPGQEGRGRPEQRGDAERRQAKASCHETPRTCRAAGPPAHHP